MIVYRFKHEVYEGQFMLWSLLKSRKGAWLFIAISGLIATMAYLNINLDMHPINRILVHASGGILCFYTCFYDRNFYFNNNVYWIDRIGVALLFVLSLNYIFFYLGFVFYSLLFIKQSQKPDISHFTFTDKSYFYEILFFIPLYAWVTTYLPFDLEQRYLTIAIWSFPTLWYVAAGAEKLSIRWWENHLERFLYNAKLSGFLRSFSGMLSPLYTFIKRFRPVVIWFVIIIELGAVCLFAEKGIALFLLAALILMHVFILIVSGIFFWKWILFDGLFIWAITLFDAPEGLFSLTSTILLIGLTGLAMLLPHHFLHLGWYDVGGFGFYRFWAIGKDGLEVELDPSFFTPYDLPITQGRFTYLHDKKILFDNFGSVLNRAVNKAFKTSLSHQEVEAYIEAFGKNTFNPARKAIFDAFITRFVRNKLSGKKPAWITAPLHIYRFGGHRRFIPKVECTQVKIQYVTMYKPNFESSITISETTYVLELF